MRDIASNRRMIMGMLSPDMPAPAPRRQWILIVLGLLFVLSLIVRSSYLGLAEYKGDESTAVDLATRLVHGEFIQTGLVSSTGLLNPPIFVYLLALPGLLSLSPLTLTAFVILCNSFALIFLLFVLEKRLQSETALTVAALFASAPWPILYARKIWAQDLLFPFLALFYGVLLSYLEKPRVWKVVAAAALLAVITQLHMSGWFFLVAFVAFLLLYRVRVTLNAAVMGAAAFVALYAPFLWYQLRTGFSDFGNLHSDRAHDLSSFWTGIREALQTTTGLEFGYVMGGGGYDAFLHWAPVWILLPFFLLYLTLAICGWFAGARMAALALRARWKGKKATPLALLVSFLILACVAVEAAYALMANVYPHYQIILYPALPLLAALFLREQGKDEPAKTLVRVAVIGIVAAQLAFTFGVLRFIAAHPEQIDGDYGQPYVLQDHGAN